MEKLWSPWRSNYIDSFKTKKDSETCVFCEAPGIRAESDESLVVYRDKLCFVMLNLFPYNSGHLMIIPYRHLFDINGLTGNEMTEIMRTAGLSVRALEMAMRPQGYNFGANLGKAAGAGVDQHIHFHLVPRWNGDTNFMPALGEVKVISHDLLATKKNLTEAFNKLD